MTKINQIASNKKVWNLYDMGGAHSVPNYRTLEDFEEALYTSLTNDDWPKIEINLLGWTNRGQLKARSYLDAIGFVTITATESGTGAPYLQCHTIEHDKLMSYFSGERIIEWEEARKKRVEEARIAEEARRKAAVERELAISKFVERLKARDIEDGRKEHELRVGDKVYYNHPRLYPEHIYTVNTIGDGVVKDLGGAGSSGSSTWTFNMFLRIPDESFIIDQNAIGVRNLQW
jgi:hypothetical protein